MKKLIVAPTRIAQELRMSFPTVQSALQRLEQLGIVREITGRKRNKMYGYEKALAVWGRVLEQIYFRFYIYFKLKLI